MPTLWSELVIDEEDEEETLSKYRDDCGDDVEPDEWDEDDDLDQIL